ncbi:MAG: phosphate ABC transporter substrate-binding protein, partial [Alphaproteobacteria bacterium]|nr:phosphate ABC transporter substrate-binding protein [Alphaproteobacteria bacterium]
MNKNVLVLAVAAAVSVAGAAQAQSARDHIRMAGSSTVYPFATTVAERFGKS